MKLLSRIWFPVALTAVAFSAAAGIGSDPIHMTPVPDPSGICDTVIYPHDGYKLRRVGNFEDNIPDSLRNAGGDFSFDEDTIPLIFARDTMKVPDSLRWTDPFRFKYYVALRDSLTHRIVRDSLIKRIDSLKLSSRGWYEKMDSVAALQDSLMAYMDSLDWRRLDSIYYADSTIFAKARFLAWFNSLSKIEKKKYLAEQKAQIKIHEMDSIREIKDEKKAIRDSITEYTPRILETFALPDSMFYKRIITWTVDPDFQKLDVKLPDTSFNYHFYDYPFQRKDVNATWLGVAGSSVQTYDVTKRENFSGVDFYAGYESWTFEHNNLPFYNTKTPYTELSYTGTLFASDSKASHNLHLFTTQNILPELNFSLLFDRYGGGGMLENEKTTNKTAAVQLNYLGKKYMGHLAYVHNHINQGENGGIVDNLWIRDTTVDARDIPINLKSAQSEIDRHTVFLDQQFRIPFNFINKIRAKKDSNYVFSADSLDRNITTAFLGHSSEFSTYSRGYSDNITDIYGQKLYNDVFNYNTKNSMDTLGLMKIDNKVFLRLQPWADDAIVSKLDLGIGDYFKQYAAEDTLAGGRNLYTKKQNENSMYLYAGIEGQYKKYLKWDAKADYVLLGHDFADFGVSANMNFKMFPFRKARSSPISIDAHFETSLREPNFYQQRMFSNHYAWDNDFSKISTTVIKGGIDIPKFRTKAEVGYTLKANAIYYDEKSIVRQCADPVSVLTFSVRNDLKLGPLHLDNQVLVQLSSDQSVIPVPLAALNMKWYLDFVLQRDAEKKYNVLEMQVGINAWYNTQWYSPAWNPNIGVWYNQQTNLYENGPYFDVFLNMQWKRCCIFIKYQNVAKGWPMKHPDYFSADGHIVTQDGIDGLKIGIFWPFYLQPHKK